MEKYIYLKEGEIITPDVELHDPEGKFWEGNDYTNTPVAKNWVGYFRRPIPHAGDVQFLMAVSIMVPVIVNCDGQTQEEIEDEAGQLAVEKVMANPREYVHFENIDWGSCKVDEIQPEPKISAKYRPLIENEVIQNGDEIKFNEEWKPAEASNIGVRVGGYAAGVCMVRRPIIEPQKKNIYDEEGNPIFKKSVVPRYRPFVDGDVIEEGDQWRWKKERTEWLEARSIDIGTEIKEDFNCFRKLIK